MNIRGYEIGPGANLRGANLRGADLLGADLYDADFRCADLRGANLRGVNLWDANFRGASLCGASLYGASVCGANLRDASLRGANLRDASLRDANLYGASLRGADLRGTFFIPSMLLLAQWGTVSDELTIKLMRLDASAHPRPELFDDWKDSGDCPYDEVNVARVCNFQEQRHLWSPGPPPTIWEAVSALLDECTVTNRNVEENNEERHAETVANRKEV